MFLTYCFFAICFRFSKQYRVVGGDDAYVWHTSNSSVADVSQSGLVHVNGPGVSQVFVCASWDSKCYGKATAELYVLEPTQIEIEHNIHEALIGNPINLYIVLHAHIVGADGKIEKFRMNDCHYLDFGIGIDESFQYTVNSSSLPMGAGCATLEVVGTVAMMSKVTVSYRSSSADLRANTAVAAYNPLKPLHPHLGKAAVLALGTSRYIVFSNGPSKTFGTVHATVTVDDKIIRYESHLTRQPFYVYSITCIKHGETKFTLSLATNPLIPNCKGIHVEASIDVNCAYPSHLTLQTERDVNCPAKSMENAYARFFGVVKIKVILSDHVGRHFDNATSLLFNWNVDRKEMAFFNENSIVHLDEEEHEGFVLPLDHYKHVAVRNVSGTVVVSGKVIGYRKEVLEKLNIKSPVSKQKSSELATFLEAANVINIVNQTMVEPKVISVVNHPTNVVPLLITNGSGHYEFDIKPKSVATFEYEKPRLFIVPQMEGQGILTVRDLCAPGPLATAVINVSIIEYITFLCLCNYAV